MLEKCYMQNYFPDQMKKAHNLIIYLNLYIKLQCIETRKP